MSFELKIKAIDNRIKNPAKILISKFLRFVFFFFLRHYVSPSVLFSVPTSSFSAAATVVKVTILASWSGALL